MTLSVWQLLSVCLVPALLGLALLRLQGVSARTDPLGFGAWAWCQGCVALAIVLEVWLWLALPLRATWLGALLLALAATCFLLGRRVPLAPRAAPSSAPPWERAVFAAALAFLLCGTLDRVLLSANLVTATGDEALIWASKAKVLFHCGGFGESFRAAMQTPEVIAHPDYPPLNPLLQLWVHAHAGEIVHLENRLPIQVFGLACTLAAASALRRRARPLVAAVFLVCIGTVKFASSSTYLAFSDVLIATGCLVCWDFWQRYQEDGEVVWLRLLGATAPLLVWSKNEGLLHVLVFFAALLVALLSRRVRLPPRSALAWTVPVVLSIVYLQWFNGHFGLVNDLVQGGAGRSPEELESDPGFLRLTFEHASTNVRPILITFAQLIGTQPLQTRFLLLGFLLLLVLSPRAACSGKRLAFTLGLLLTLLGYMAVYLGTHWNVQEHLDHSSKRLVYHLLPAAGLWLCSFVVDALPALARPRPEPPTRVEIATVS